jgi:predicted nucleic acid-binding protein
MREWRGRAKTDPADMKPVVLDTATQLYIPLLENRPWLDRVHDGSCGRGIETADAWIAATALLYDAPLLTHDKSDYASVPSLRFSDD